MKTRLYFDTSVFGGVSDEEFKNETKMLFDMVQAGQITCVFSELTIAELQNAPEKVKSHFFRLTYKAC